MSNASDFIIGNGVLKKYVGPGGDVVIPEGVETIDAASLQGCETITSVILPKSLKIIGSNTFQDCTALEKVTIQSEIRKMGFDVFKNCSSLKSAVFSDGVKTICKSFFDGCTALESVIVPESLCEICAYAFRDCEALKDFTLPAQTRVADGAFVGCAGLANEEGWVIVSGNVYGYYGPEAEITIPEGITAISSHAFVNHTGLKSVSIPDWVSTIGGYAFHGCRNMHTVQLPSGLTRIDDGVFLECSALKNITLPDSVRRIGWGAFSDCIHLEQIVIPEGVTEIPDWMFQGCIKLQRVIIPDSVYKIGKQAFDGCSQLFELRLPKGIRYEQLIPARLDAVSAYVMGNLDASDEILAKVQSLIKTHREKLMQKIVEMDSEHAFVRFCGGWKKIKLEHLEEYIEIATKADATKVTAALLDYKQRNYSAKEHETKEQDRVEKELGIKELSVADWRKIFKFSVKDGIATLTDYKGTEPSAVIPEKIGKNVVAQISRDGFKGCKGLKEVTIPATMKEIGFRSFYHCPDLEIVRFSQGVESTGNCSFCVCQNLKHAYIPASVKQIISFVKCHALTIHAPAGSYAETYAKENNIPFVAE